MLSLVVWAMLTGMVTGGVWVAIVLKQHQKKLEGYQPELLSRMEERLEMLESVEGRLAEMEERLDFTERVIKSDPEPPRLPPQS
ncbi:MAG: hypothetical protein V4558_16110 [Gemmatimonadota bacterium]